MRTVTRWVIITATITKTKLKVRFGWLRGLKRLARRHLRYRVTRTGWLFALAMALVTAGALASANNLLFLIVAAMLATLLISGFISRLSLAGLQLELTLPEHLTARQDVTARVKLRNLKHIPSFAIRLTGRGGAAPAIMDREIVFPVLPGRRAVEVSVPVRFPRRGPQKENLFTISTRFPFGFVERRAWVEIAGDVVVYPALKESAEAMRVLAGVEGELEHDRRGLGSDFYRLRPYDYSESARNLDWKSSAHTGELQVREFTAEERPRVDVYFDLRAEMDAEAAERFERRVECCAWVVWRTAESGARMRFRTQRCDWEIPETADVYRLLRELALVEPVARAAAPLVDAEERIILFSGSPQEFARAGWEVKSAAAI